MVFELLLANSVSALVDDLESKDPQQHRKVIRCLAKLEQNPEHPGLQSHPYRTFDGPNGEAVFESYVENRTPAAWRVWWFYGPERRQITVVDLGPHP
ncbi:MAG: hypothetical protein ACRDZR_11700 [Acidimicrobiales bacterium]